MPCARHGVALLGLETPSVRKAEGFTIYSVVIGMKDSPTAARSDPSQGGNRHSTPTPSVRQLQQEGSTSCSNKVAPTPARWVHQSRRACISLELGALVLQVTQRKRQKSNAARCLHLTSSLQVATAFHAAMGSGAAICTTRCRVSHLLRHAAMHHSRVRSAVKAAPRSTHSYENALSAISESRGLHPPADAPQHQLQLDVSTICRPTHDERRLSRIGLGSVLRFEGGLRATYAVRDWGAVTSCPGVLRDEKKCATMCRPHPVPANLAPKTAPARFSAAERPLQRGVGDLRRFRTARAPSMGRQPTYTVH